MYILDTIEIYSGDASAVQSHLCRVIKEFEIDVTLVISDSASVMTSAITSAGFQRSYCCVHLINIICSDAISRSPSVVSVLEHLSKITGNSLLQFYVLY